jgi:hypothetical protein
MFEFLSTNQISRRREAADCRGCCALPTAPSSIERRRRPVTKTTSCPTTTTTSPVDRHKPRTSFIHLRQMSTGNSSKPADEDAVGVLPALGREAEQELDLEKRSTSAASFVDEAKVERRFLWKLDLCLLTWAWCAYCIKQIDSSVRPPRAWLPLKLRLPRRAPSLLLRTIRQPMLLA